MIQLPTQSKARAIIDIVAPAGRFAIEVIDSITTFLTAHNWTARVPLSLLGAHDFLANSDELRLSQLKQALLAPDSDIIWCVRGGHGTTRIMQELLSMPKPPKPKLIVGFSDITTLHLGVNQVWQWPSLHAPMAGKVASGASDVRDVAALLHLWRDGISAYTLTGLLPQNRHAACVTDLTGLSAGTCLSLLQASLGTLWQLQTTNKVVFIEDVNEPAYRLDRMLVHLSNAGLWQQATAIVLGDFEQTDNVLESQKIARVLAEFAHAQRVPVFSLSGFGHGARNKPIPLGVNATIQPDAESFNIVFSI